MTDLSQVRDRLQATWAAGDFHRLGVEQLIVGEQLCEEVGMQAGQRVLDVACGAGKHDTCGGSAPCPSHRVRLGAGVARSRRAAR